VWVAEPSRSLPREDIGTNSQPARRLRSGERFGEGGDDVFGGFGADGQEYVTILGPGQQTPAPWINVVSNASFGFQVATEPTLVDIDGEAADDAVAHQAADPVGRSIGGKVHAITQGLVRNPRIIAEDGADFAVETIKR